MTDFEIFCYAAISLCAFVSQLHGIYLVHYSPCSLLLCYATFCDCDLSSRCISCWYFFPILVKWCLNIQSWIFQICLIEQNLLQISFVRNSLYHALFTHVNFKSLPNINRLSFCLYIFHPCFVNVFISVVFNDCFSILILELALDWLIISYATTVSVNDVWKWILNWIAWLLI